MRFLPKQTQEKIRRARMKAWGMDPSNYAAFRLGYLEALRDSETLVPLTDKTRNDMVLRAWARLTGVR